MVQYIDYSSGQPDKSKYIPNLVPGILQPLKELLDAETDEFLSTIALVKEAEQSTGSLPPTHPAPADKDLKRFRTVTSEEELKQMTNRSFSAVIKRTALWAACIFDQWKCVLNYKLKADSSLTYPEIIGTLVNMDLQVMCDTLSLCS